MRELIFAADLALAVVAYAGRPVDMGPLPAWDCLDTEVSTNAAFAVGGPDNRYLTFELELYATPSNNVQVAFGQDLDGDGDLAPDESDLVLGWRRGSCFIEDVEGEARRFADSTEGVSRVSLEMTVKTDDVFRPRRAAFTNELGECFSDLGVEEYLFKTNWNLLKVTRRGVEAADEWCRITSTYRSFAVHIR